MRRRIDLRHGYSTPSRSRATDHVVEWLDARLKLLLRRVTQDRSSPDVLRRIGRDVESGLASGEVRGTPTLFIDGIVHLGGYDAATLMEALPG